MKHSRITTLLATWVAWCISYVEMYRCPYLVLNIVCSRFTLARDDPGYCITTWKESFMYRSSTNVYGPMQQLPLTKSSYWNSHVSTQGWEFFTEYILSDSHPIGHILEYVIKIEFQMWGSLHVHCLLWVKDSPKINEDPNEVVYQFIDNYITAQIPEPMHANEIDIKLMNSYKSMYIWIIADRTIHVDLGFQNHHLLKHLLHNLQIVKTKMKC